MITENISFTKDSVQAATNLALLNIFNHLKKRITLADFFSFKSPH